MTTTNTVRIKWNGDTSVNREVGAATGNGDVIEAGAELDVPAELADELLASSTSWERVTTTAKGAK